MPLPSKALRYGQLKFKSAGEAVPTSGHEVFKVEFVDAAGETKKGFYKPLASSYPRILAEYSVASSVFMGTLVDRVAEERLVLNDQDEVIGTISIAIPNFRPLQQWSDSTSSNPQEKELICPSVESLLQNNFAELLVLMWIIGEDDGHPGNVSTLGLIDGDMRLYDITYIMKGGRLSDSFLKAPPEQLMRLKRWHLDNFPISLPGTHSPARTIPANGNVIKVYKNYAEFQKLASNPSLRIEDGKISFQDQLFSALLKQLIGFDPEMLRSRLEHYFGDIKFNYSCLDEKQRTALAKIHPNFFQPVFEEQETFVDHIMKVFNERYQQLYRAVVFYTGCPQNESNTAVIAFSDYLRNKPSAFSQIITQAEEKNKKMEQAWSCVYPSSENSSNENIDADFTHIKKSIDVDACVFKPTARFNLVKMEQRYHQVWRDSLIFLIKDSLADAQQLTENLIKELQRKPITLPSLEKNKIALDDVNLIKSTQLLEEKDFDIDSVPIECDKENSILLGLKELLKFRESLKQAALDYYKLEKDELTLEKNQIFCRKVSMAIENYEANIYKCFAGTGWIKIFGALMTKIYDLYGNFNFQRHLNSADVSMDNKVRYNYAALLNVPHTEEHVMSAAIKALFDWVNRLDEDTFKDTVSNIISGCYTASTYNFLSNRNREKPVKLFLKKPSTEDNANKLAFILSSGGHASTSLNTQLIKNLMEIFISRTINGSNADNTEDETRNAIDVNLISVEYACDRGTFDDYTYTLRAIKYAKEDARFSHLYSKDSLTRFNKWMYKWVDSLERKQFDCILKEALNQYQPYSWNWFSTKSRSEEIYKALNDKHHSNSGILANLFTQGQIKSGSFNTILFNILLNKMQTAISIGKIQDPNAQLIMQVANNDSHLQYYLQCLADYAKHQTYESHPLLTEHTTVAVL
ncbi:hypothetical protein ACNVED_00050 [Legionella sp. D16C41]|uniref:hypothetical protein n=1 Tax=Legionella sp. D16C41 TaxID=3402688 RepID=UPI003AF776DC